MYIELIVFSINNSTNEIEKNLMCMSQTVVSAVSLITPPHSVNSGILVKLILRNKGGILCPEAQINRGCYYSERTSLNGRMDC